MQVIVTKPSEDRTMTVKEIRFVPGTSKLIHVIVADPYRGRQTQIVDISTQWTNAAQADKDVLKTFFKFIAATALDQANEADAIDVVPGDVDGEVFE